MTLRKRIDRLDRGNVRHREAPSHIVLCGICPKTGEAISAGIMGSETLNREAGETEPEFLMRVTEGAELSRQADNAT